MGVVLLKLLSIAAYIACFGLTVVQFREIIGQKQLQFKKFDALESELFPAEREHNIAVLQRNKRQVCPQIEKDNCKQTPFTPASNDHMVITDKTEGRSKVGISSTDEHPANKNLTAEEIKEIKRKDEKLKKEINYMRNKLRNTTGVDPLREICDTPEFKRIFGLDNR